MGGENQNPKNKNQGNSKVQGKTAVARNRVATVDLPRRRTLRIAERPPEGSVASAHGMKRPDRRLRRGATPDPIFPPVGGVHGRIQASRRPGILGTRSIGPSPWPCPWGFKQVSHFCRQFKQFHQWTPTEFVAQHHLDDDECRSRIIHVAFR